MKYDVIAGVSFPHRLLTRKTEEEVNQWCLENDYVRIRRMDVRIGCFTTETHVVSRFVYNNRPDLH